jgi:Putative zinc-finger
MKSMDHSEAVRLGAAERYLLGELPPDERERFEEHYFGCLECAQDVRAGAVFVDGARDILRVEGDRAPERVALGESSRGWWASLFRPAVLVPVMALLILFVAYQNIVVIPGLSKEVSESSTPQTLQSFSLVTANSRAGGAISITVPQNKPFTLFVDIPPDNQFSFYTCDLQTESGTLIVSSKVSAEDAKETVQLLIPPSRLGVGKYVLIVRGRASNAETSTEVTRYPFALNFSK